MKKFNYTLLIALTCLSCFQLAAQESETQERARASAAVSYSQHEENEWKEKRAAEDEYNQQHMEEIPEEERPAELAKSLEGESESELKTLGIFSSEERWNSHWGVRHSIINKSQNHCSSIEIEDGSVWDIKGSDRDLVKQWSFDSKLILVPNHSWFSSYDYKFINQDNQQSARTNLNLLPYLDSIYTLWVEDVDYANLTLRLCDGSCWTICSSDSSEMRLFKKLDVVILGRNDGWWSSSNPNILIHVSSKKYARAKRVF